jgi:thiol:disulfide interchange protein DsbD
VVLESAKFSMIKVDLTKGASPDAAQLLKKYNVKGVPTVIFLDPHATELRALQTIDYISGKEFLNKMKTALEQ